eukprot:1567722-Rhodomonas_salina.6
MGRGHAGTPPVQVLSSSLCSAMSFYARCTVSGGSNENRQRGVPMMLWLHSAFSGPETVKNGLKLETWLEKLRSKTDVRYLGLVIATYNPKSNTRNRNFCTTCTRNE